MGNRKIELGRTSGDSRRKGSRAKDCRRCSSVDYCDQCAGVGQRGVRDAEIIDEEPVGVIVTNLYIDLDSSRSSPEGPDCCDRKGVGTGHADGPKESQYGATTRRQGERLSNNDRHLFFSRLRWCGAGFRRSSHCLDVKPVGVLSTPREYSSPPPFPSSLFQALRNFFLKLARPDAVAHVFERNHGPQSNSSQANWSQAARIAG